MMRGPPSSFIIHLKKARFARCDARMLSVSGVAWRACKYVVCAGFARTFSSEAILSTVVMVLAPKGSGKLLLIGDVKNG